MLHYLFWSAGGFLSGSVMYSYLIPKLLFQKDITHISKDGNPGCGNVFTCIGIPCGIVCLLLELGKGAVPMWLALRYVQPSHPLFAAVMASPVLGHAFTPMLKRRGGKAIAVTFGTFIGLCPHMLMLFWLALPLVIFSTILRICPHSLRVMTSYLCMLTATVLLEPAPAAWLGAVIITVTVIGRHYDDYLHRERQQCELYCFSHCLYQKKERYDTHE